jgi:hypothetical protein
LLDRFVVNDEKITIYECDIDTYVDDSFWSAYKIYKRIKELGLPNGQGWVNEQNTTLKIWDIFDSERIIAEQRSTEEAAKNGHNSGKGSNPHRR